MMVVVVVVMVMVVVVVVVTGDDDNDDDAAVVIAGKEVSTRLCCVLTAVKPDQRITLSAALCSARTSHTVFCFAR